MEVSHYDLGSAAPDMADVFFVGGDLADSAQHLGWDVVLDSIIDLDELKQKGSPFVRKKDYYKRSRQSWTNF